MALRRFGMYSYKGEVLSGKRDYSLALPVKRHAVKTADQVKAVTTLSSNTGCIHSDAFVPRRKLGAQEDYHKVVRHLHFNTQHDSKF